MLANISYSFVTPPGLFVIILLVLSLYALQRPRRIILALLLILLSLLIYLASIPITTFYLNRWFIDVYKPQLPPNGERAAVIVLAGGSSKDENGKPFQPSINAMERLYTGVRLTKEHPSFSYLILSGDDPSNNISAAEVLNTSAKVMDCQAKIILEDKSRNTDENLAYCAQIVRKINVPNVIIVTSNYHIRRAVNFAYLYMPTNVKIYPYPKRWTKTCKS